MMAFVLGFDSAALIIYRYGME